MSERAYVPEFTRERTQLSNQTERHGSPIHAWFEYIPTRGARKGRPFGSRSLCGKGSSYSCREFDGFASDYPDAQEASRRFFSAPMCRDCREALAARPDSPDEETGR